MPNPKRQAPVPTVINLRLFDHTLDGILNVVSLGLFLDFGNLDFLLAERDEKEMGQRLVYGTVGGADITYLSSLSDMVVCVLI